MAENKPLQEHDYSFFKTNARKAICLFLTFVLAFSMVPISSKSAEAENSTYQIPVTYGQTEARGMLQAINDFRASGAKCWNESNTQEVAVTGLKPLVYDYDLEKTAMQRAAEIAVSFSHTRPNGFPCFTAFPPNYTAMAENIAVGSTTADQVFVDWREDDEKYDGQGHRRNMLSSAVTSVGIGHVVFNGIHYWVQNFGGPAKSTSVTSATNGSSTVNVDIESSFISSKSLSANTKSVSLTVGKSAALPQLSSSMTVVNNWPRGSFTFAPTNVSWTSSNPSVATISGNTVVAKKAGTTSLKAASNGMVATVSVVVSSALAKPSAVSLKSVKGGKKSVTVKWGKAKVGTGYEICCSTSKKFTKKTTVKKAVSKIKTVSLVVKKLKKNKTYYVKVRSFNKDKASGKVLYSNWSKVKKAKTKK